jgi:hypothetical protein
MIQSDSWRTLQDHGWQGNIHEGLQNPQTGQKATWDEETGQWVESVSGRPLTADPNATL